MEDAMRTAWWRTNMKKTHWTSYGMIVCYTLFFVFCFFFIIDSRFSSRLAQLNLRAAERGLPMSISPKNLESAPESFRLGLRAESGSFPTEEMTKTKAWNTLQNTVSGYAQRLDILEKQHRKQSSWTLRLSVVSMIGAILCGFSSRTNGHKEAPGASETGKAGTDTV
jgi:hypothetical protein